MAVKKDYITYPEFLKRFDAGKIAPIYLFQGQETFLLEECIERIKHALIAPEAVDFNVDKFYGKELKAASDALDQAQTMPFLSKWRLIIISNIDDASAAVQKQMLPYLLNPNPSTCLVLTVAAKLDARKKFGQVVKKQAEVVQFWKLFENKLPSWISERAQFYGYRMSRQTAAYLADIVGNELRQIDNELKKVIAYANTKELTSTIVEEVVGDVRERSVFEMVDAVSLGKLVDALKTLNQLLIEGEEPLKILALLARQFRLLWQTKASIAEHKSLSSNALAGKIGVSPKMVESLRGQAQRFSQVKLKQGLKRMSEVDLALKTSANSPKMLLEDLFIDLCI